MKVRIIKTLLVCSLALLIGYVYFKNDDLIEVPVSNIIYNENKLYKEIVFQDESQTLIPVNIEIEKKDTIEQEVAMIINLMKTEPVKFKGLYPVIESNIILNNIQIKDGLLTLDFSDGLMQLSKSNSLNFIEALTWSLCNYKDIQSIHLTCNNNEVTNLPESYISLTQNYDHSLGLNNFETVNAYLHQTSSLVVYGTKFINGQMFYVPMTRRVNDSSLSLIEKVTALFTQGSITSLLEKNKVLSGLEVLEGTRIEDGRLVVDLNDQALLDEMSLNPQIADLLILSLKQIEGVETIGFEVNHESVGEDEIVSKEVVYNLVAL